MLDWREEPIGRHHDRKGFDCGSSEPNEYLDRYARPNHESGGVFLLAAGERALAVSAVVGGIALAIDAKDASAARWYERFGALALLNDPLKLVLPLSVIADAVTRNGRPSRP